MKRNRIVIFNRLTDHELEEVSVFENLVGDHYDKFCRIYEIISDKNIIKNIIDISCKIGNDDIKFIIDFQSKISKKIREYFIDSIGTWDSSIDFSIEGKNMILSIKNN